MAKTISPPAHPPESSTLIPSQRQPSAPSGRPRRRRSPLAPSPTLLSLLATIAASSTTVDGSPAPPPPSFLCPSLDPDNAPTLVVDPPLSSSARPSTVYLPSSVSPKRLASRSVPDQFTQGDDGVWRRVESYTLYGSTVCPSCREPTNAVSSVDDQMQDSHDPEPSPATTTSYDIINSLPQGWNSSDSHTARRTSVILAFSLALAVIICFFMIGCLFWRKSMKRRFKENEDIEMKARKRGGGEVDPVEHARLVAEKDAKVKQKLWARATARWKANARYSARQRRGKRIVSSTRSQANYSVSSLDHHIPPEESSSAHSSRQSSPSRASSRRSSIDSHLEGPSDVQGMELSQDIDNIPSISLSPPQASSSSPPAYRQQGLHLPLENLSVSDCDRSRHSPSFSSAPHSPSYFPNPHSRRPSHASLHSPHIGVDMQLEPDTYESPIHSAHVAIDDKTVLARLAEFASSPPQGGSHNTEVSSAPLSSAPEWHDEELDEFDLPRDTPVCRSRSSSPVGLFPPPPSKGKMAAADFMQYSLTFEEEMAALEPEEPSAPPFEAEINSDHRLAPSAPPLLDDEPDHTEYPSAPAWNSLPEVHLDEQSNDHHSSDRSSPREVRSPSNQQVEDPAVPHGDLPVYLP